jgi:hypothetical protein
MDWYRQRPYTLRMNSLGHAVGLRVNDDGLRMQAGWWEAAAGALVADSAPVGVDVSWPVSSAAVNAAHAQIAAARIRCTSRMQATATKLAVAATGYADNEARSAAQMRALYRPTAC